MSTAEPPQFDMPRISLEQCACRLDWANEREVESEYLQSGLHAETMAAAWLILKGSAEVRDGSERLRIPAGHWFFPRRMNGEQTFSKGARILSVRFGLRNPGGEEVLPRDRHLLFDAQQFPELEAAAREMVRCTAGLTQRGSLFLIRDQVPLDVNLEIQAAFFRWLAAYARMRMASGCRPFLQTIEDARVRQALTLIEQHPMRQPFRVSALARACGLGVNRLGALFHEAAGQTPRQYYETLRLERAQHLLRDTDYRIKETAWALGFHSLPHFSNWFKSRTGRSPRSYQREEEAKGSDEF